VERREAVHLEKQALVREKFAKNNGHCALQLWWGRRKYIAIRSKIIYRRATKETARTETKINSGAT